MAAVAGKIQLTEDDIPGAKLTKEVQKLARLCFIEVVYSTGIHYFLNMWSTYSVANKAVKHAKHNAGMLIN